jgi:hypothetical protein
MLLVPVLLDAAGTISLDERQDKAVSKGEIVVRETGKSTGKGRTFEAIGRIKASKISLMGILKDYAKYPEFMPNVSRVEIVEQKGNEAVLNYTLALPMGKVKRYRLRILEKDIGGRVSTLEWKLVNWPELKSEETISDTSGYWRVEDKGENTALVLYHVYTDPGPVPLGLGWIVDHLTKKSIPQVFLQTRRRAERLSGNR